MKAIVLFFGLVCLCNFLCTNVTGQENNSLRGSSWQEVIDAGEGEIKLYWFRSNPLIYEENDSLKGIEYEVVTSFVRFIEDIYSVSISTDWQEAAQFEDLISGVSKSSGGVFGMSGISITESRKSIVQFTPPHLSDICVLISSPNVPVERTTSEFLASLDGLTVLTIKGSTFEQKLLEIQDEHNLALTWEYIDSTQDLIENLENIDNGFGYIDLRTFLIDLNNGTPVRRQYFYPLKLPGLSLVFPIDSDWNIPVETYFQSEQFIEDNARIVEKYLGKEIIEVIERIARSADLGPEEEIIILTKERELQYEELLNQSIKMQADQKIMYLLILIILILILFAAIFYTRYRVKLAANRMLAEKQREIESKNSQLVDLNHEKDNLIGLLAHDLRAPIGHIIGITRIIKENPDNRTQEMYDLILKDSEKLNTLITKILDVEAIENHRHNLNITDVDAVEVIDDLVKDHEEHATNKEIKVETSFARSKMLFKADKVYLTQALENLLSNALKFSNPGTSVSIEIDDKKIIHVKDQGPGFTDEDKRKVFKKFQRLSAKPTGGETSIGLGMITVRMFVELMKGELSFDSQVGEGTIFHIKLPAVN